MGYCCFCRNISVGLADANGHGWGFVNGRDTQSTPSPSTSQCPNGTGSGAFPGPALSSELSTRMFAGAPLHVKLISHESIEVHVKFESLVLTESDDELRVMFCLNCKIAVFACNRLDHWFATHHVACGPRTQSPHLKPDPTLGIVISDTFVNQLPNTLKVHWSKVHGGLRLSLQTSLNNVEQEKQLAVQQFAAEQTVLANQRKAALNALYSELENSVSQLPRMNGLESKQERDDRCGVGFTRSEDSQYGSSSAQDDLFKSDDEADDEDTFLISDESSPPRCRRTSGQEDVQVEPLANERSQAFSRPIGINPVDKTRSASFAWDSPGENTEVCDIPNKMREVSMSVRETSSDVFGELPTSNKNIRFTDLVRSYTEPPPMFTDS